LDRSVKIILVSFVLITYQCGPPQGATSDPVEPAQQELPASIPNDDLEEAEEISGSDDPNGSPDLAKIEQCQIVVSEKVQYKGDPSAAIDPKSYDVLDMVAEIIRLNPALGMIRIEVHTDSRGPDDYLLLLSEDRAKQVKKYLVEKGVPAESLIAVGYGEEKPISTEVNEEGWAMNRRTEFHIVECKDK
jgi:outer membrane protein OmpA-like peptidoglycan-associated protein